MNINQKTLEQSLVIFSDGSSLGNPGPGGYGALIISSKLGEVIELGGSKETTTNNEMELVAIVSALTYVTHNQETVHIFTDSSYVINGAESWMYGWEKKGWRKKDGEMIKNLFHWKTLFELIGERGKDHIHWHHVPGHVGIVGNERVDDIARGFAEGFDVNLFRGRLDDYPLTKVLNIKIDQKAKAKKSHSKAKAHSYLSLVDGVLMRHRSWADTEARVKGQNARFKKTISQEDEDEIIKAWGYRPSDIESSE